MERPLEEGAPCTVNIEVVGVKVIQSILRTEAPRLTLDVSCISTINPIVDGTAARRQKEAMIVQCLSYGQWYTRQLFCLSLLIAEQSVSSALKDNDRWYQTKESSAQPWKIPKKEETLEVVS